MLNRAVVSALFFGSIFVSGCSKALTESSAVGILQEYIDNHETAETRALLHWLVDRCDHLLLVTETMATATCNAHVRLTSAGEAAYRNLPTVQTIRASFGKQPAGTWVGTGGTQYVR